MRNPIIILIGNIAVLIKFLIGDIYILIGPLLPPFQHLEHAALHKSELLLGKHVSLEFEQTEQVVQTDKPVVVLIQQQK